MKTEEATSPGTMHLSPSAATPFTHDQLGSHDKIIHKTLEAVGHSGAEFVHEGNVFGGDHGAIVSKTAANFEESLEGDVQYGIKPKIEQHSVQGKVTHDLGEKVVELHTHEQSAQAEQTPSDWVKERSALPVSSWCEEASDLAYMRAHRDEIVIAFLELNPLEYIGLTNVMNEVGKGGSFGDELAYYLIPEAPNILLWNPRYFSNFSYDMKYVEAMAEAGHSNDLLVHWHLLKPDCLQPAIDFMLEKNAPLVFSLLSSLPETIQISDEYLIVMAQRTPSVLMEMMSQGRFASQASKELLKTLLEYGSYWQMLETGLLDEFDLTALKEIWVTEPGELLLHLYRHGRMTSLKEFELFVELFGVEGIAFSVSELPRAMQSTVFQELVTKPGNSWVKYLPGFNCLTSDDYIFILDSLPQIDAQIEYMDILVGLFNTADTRLQTEFRDKYAVILEQRNKKKWEYNQRNHRRAFQRQAEQSYFDAGSVNVDAHDYDAVLSPEEIIESLDSAGCVKRAGAIAEMAHDETRQNMMTCVEGATSSLSTGNLGANGGDQNRLTLTEHEVLKDFMKFTELTPVGDDRKEHTKSLKTELTFIGEKEYAEAVRGIAMYWKSFLDSDEAAQLYVDTVVSNYLGVKSDVYMLDRVLANFTDSELEKYRGRILTAGARVTQTDPAKVKVVLLDDWTISGAQLRKGYHIFTGNYPQLTKSIEVQLIAASEERIALGLEGLRAGRSFEGVVDADIPVRLRAYYVAHMAKSATRNNSRYTRITGSHSSTDYGFTSDIAHVKDAEQPMPLLASVVRPYRQEGYSPANIERLKAMNNTKETDNA